MFLKATFSLGQFSVSAAPRGAESSSERRAVSFLRGIVIPPIKPSSGPMSRPFLFFFSAARSWRPEWRKRVGVTTPRQFTFCRRGLRPPDAPGSMAPRRRLFFSPFSHREEGKDVLSHSFDRSVLICLSRVGNDLMAFFFPSPFLSAEIVV